MRIALHNFTGGEVSPILAARYDLSRYGSSVQCMENMLPGLHGDVRRRPGTLFLGSLEDEAVLLPFSFNALAEQNFVLVLSGNGLSIADIHGFDPQEGSIPRLSTPYEARHLLEICAAQVGDTVYLAHTAYPLHKLVRSTDSEPEAPLPENAIRSHGYRWTLEAVALNSSLPAPQAPICTFVRGNNDDDAGLGYTLRYKIVAVDANGKQSLASEAGSCNGKHPSDWVVGNRTDISWTAVEGATEYNIYREEAGYYGFIGVSSGTTFSDNNYQADTADTPREDWDPFADGNNPSVVAFHQQRMVLAGTRDSPQAFYLSRSGDFENFRKSRPLQDDDPVEYLIASGSIDAIAWAASFGDLLLGTSGSEYKASGNGSAITPGNITITAQSYWGSAGLAPIIIGNAILHVQRHGAHVRDLFYSLEKDGYAGNDLSILAPHLFEGHRLRQWAYQQTPGSVLWIVRDDGLLLALTYLKEHDIWGWSRHPTAGEVLSVCSISGPDSDELLLVGRRRDTDGGTRYCLERLAPQWQDSDPVEEAFFVDCGLSLHREEAVNDVDGLDHLEGQSLAVLADGSPVEGCVVRQGRIRLPFAARIVQAGLPYASVLSPLPVEGNGESGSTLGRQRALGRCCLRLYRSVGGRYGAGRDELYDIPFLPRRWDEACQPFSGDVDFLPAGGHGPSATIWLVQERPLPFHLLALSLDVEFAEI